MWNKSGSLSYSLQHCLALHCYLFIVDDKDSKEQGHSSPLGSAQSTSSQAEEGTHHTERRQWRWNRGRWDYNISDLIHYPLVLLDLFFIFLVFHDALKLVSFYHHSHKFSHYFLWLSGFDVAKTGDARVGFVGFPSVGKSTLLSNLAGVYSEVAAYEFTTLTTVPGVIRYKGAKIQVQIFLFYFFMTW